MKGEGKSKVVFLWPYLEWGGAQIYFSAMMKLLRGRREVVAVMPEGSDPKLLGYMERLGVACEFFPSRMDLSVAATVWHKVRRRIRDTRCAWVIARHMGRHDPGRTILHADIRP